MRKALLYQRTNRKNEHINRGKKWINTTAEYALRAVVYMASIADPDNRPEEQAHVSRDDIARQTQIPNDYLVKVMKGLERDGLIRAQRGPGGGYRLMQSAETMTVYDVVSAVSTVPRIRECPLKIKDHTKLCPLHARLDAVAAETEKALRATPIVELVPQRSRRKGCVFPTAPLKPKNE